MLLNHFAQGVGIAYVTGTWQDAVMAAAKQAGQNFPVRETPGLIEVRIIARGTDEPTDPASD